MNIPAIWRALLAAAPVRMWALILAGPPITLAAGALVGIVWRGGWPKELAGQQLTILGWALWIVLGLIAVIIVTLAAARVKASGPGGTSFEVDSDNDDPAVTVETRTEVRP